VKAGQISACGERYTAVGPAHPPSETQVRLLFTNTNALPGR
jgi:hypothetical protein